MALLAPKLEWEMANPRWAAILNPFLSNPMLGGHLIKDVVVKGGTNTINHGLGEKLQGWIIVGSSAAITTYDSQKTNQKPELTLQLVCSGPATLSLYVF